MRRRQAPFTDNDGYFKYTEVTNVFAVGHTEDGESRSGEPRPLADPAAHPSPRRWLLPLAPAAGFCRWLFCRWLLPLAPAAGSCRWLLPLACRWRCRPSVRRQSDVITALSVVGAGKPGFKWLTAPLPGTDSFEFWYAIRMSLRMSRARSPLGAIRIRPAGYPPTWLRCTACLCPLQRQRHPRILTARPLQLRQGHPICPHPGARALGIAGWARLCFAAALHGGARLH